MENTSDYLIINKGCWNLRTEQHVNSEFYNLENFINGTSSLNEIELKLLGNLEGKKILHLQCHFGQDTLSLARMGAEVTGVDFSEKGIDKARELANQLNLKADFICCDIYSLPLHLSEQFDIVFTSYGTVGWLPDLNQWAGVVAHFLKPAGQFIIADFHPYVWMYSNDFRRIQYSYFNIDAIEETETGTYADKHAPIVTKSISWNHPLSDIINCLVQSELTIRSLNEFDYSPYNCFENMEEFEKGKFRLKIFENKVPIVYSILAIK